MTERTLWRQRSSGCSTSWRHCGAAWWNNRRARRHCSRRHCSRWHCSRWHCSRAARSNVSAGKRRSSSGPWIRCPGHSICSRIRCVDGHHRRQHIRQKLGNLGLSGSRLDLAVNCFEKAHVFRLQGLQIILLRPFRNVRREWRSLRDSAARPGRTRIARSSAVSGSGSHGRRVGRLAAVSGRHSGCSCRRGSGG